MPGDIARFLLEQEEAKLAEELPSMGDGEVVLLLRQWDVPACIAAELTRRLNREEPEVFVLPVSITEAVRSHFGSGQRTFTAIVKRVKFAYSVWQGKYGPWTPEQAEYAEELCLWAINRAAHGTNPGHARALVYLNLDRIVHHENTHEGFKRRADEGFDITAELQEVLS